MKLNNPPVIQTWISFTFAPGVEKPPWNSDTAGRFLKRYVDHLPVLQAVINTTFHIRTLLEGKLSHQVEHEDTLDKASAFNADQTHWLQLADDQVVYNQTRAGLYLGFEALRDEALSKLADYVEFFRPEALVSVELHYVDLIEIPPPADRKLQLQDYFNLRMETPERFGFTSQFSTQLVIQPDHGGDVLEVRFQSVEPDPETGNYRFRLDWHFVCRQLDSWEKPHVGARLDQAHTCLLDYFRASVTERTWQLFQPSDEG